MESSIFASINELNPALPIPYKGTEGRSHHRIIGFRQNRQEGVSIIDSPLFAIETSNKEWLRHAQFRLTEAEIHRDSSHDYRLLFSACPSYLLLASPMRHGHLIINGTVHTCSPEKVYILPPGPRVEIHFLAAHEPILYLFHFDFAMAGPTDADAGLGRQDVMTGVVPSTERLLSLCQTVAAHWDTDDTADRFVSQAGFQHLLHLLFKNPDPHEHIFHQVRRFMERHYAESMTVDDLAGMAGMSRYYFMRSFKERFGQSAMEYLTEIRMNRAKQYLEEGGTLREIADKVGYKDAQYFSSQFNKHVGIAPSIYTANRNNKIAAYSWPNIGHLLTLQIVPYAAPIDQSWTDEYRKKYRFDIKIPLSHDYDFNREALCRAQPDKIVALEEMITEEEKDKLRQIAPVLFLPWHTVSWRVHLQMTARFLDREKEGEKWLARYADKAAAVREIVPVAMRRGSLLIISISPKGISVWGRRAGTVLYDDLRIACAQGVQQIAFTECVAIGRLEEYESDVLLVHIMKDPQSQALWKQAQSAASWAKLKPVRDGQVYVTASPAWVAEPILEYTAYRHDHLLDELHQVFRAQ